MTPKVRFIESPEFVDEAESHLGLLGLLALQLELAARPERGDLMVGTGGFRKVRVALAGRGKSGGARAIYLYLSGPEIVFLLALYTKSSKQALSGAEKNALRIIAQRLKTALGG